MKEVKQLFGLKSAGAIFIEGLAGVFSNRGVYNGYWIGKSDVKCDTVREDGSGKLSNSWGRFSIRFIVPNFPTPWEAKWSYCEAEPTFSWNGTPVTPLPFLKP